MKYTKLLLVLVVFIILTPLVYASTLDVNLTHVWHFDENRTTATGELALEDTVGDNWMHTFANVITNSTEAISGVSLNFTPAAPGSNNQLSAVRTNNTFCSEMDGNFNYTLVFWTRSKNPGGALLGRMFDLGTFEIFSNVPSSGEWEYVPTDTKGGIVQIPSNEWVMIALVHNQTADGGYYLYANGSTRVDYDITSATISPSCTGANDVMGGSEFGNDYYIGIVDEMMIWNRTLDPGELAQLWNNQSGLFCTGDPCSFVPESPTPNLNVTITYPSDGQYVNPTSYLWVNVTTNASSACYMNDTRFIFNTSNASNTTFAWLNTSFAEGNYSVNVSCINISVNGSAVSNFVVDTVLPIISTGFSFNDIFQIWKPQKHINVTSYVNVSDDNLYSLLINDSINGVILNVTNIAGTTYNYTVSLNVSNYTVGNNPITIRVADGHTAERINEWDQSKNVITKKITFDYRDSIFESSKYLSVRPTNVGLMDDFDTEKQFDRYLYKYTSPFSGKTEIVFEFKSSSYIDIVNKEKNNYKGWLVIPALNKWSDLELENPTGKEVYSIRRISGNEVEITVSNLDGRKEYVFHSAGDLNIVTETYVWSLVNVSESQVAAFAIENSTSVFTFNITKHNTNLSTNATFYYNTTNYPPTKTSTLAYDFYNVSIQNVALSGRVLNYSAPVNWSYNVTSSTKFEENRTNQTAFVYEIILDECTAYVNQSAINFTLIDLTTLEPVGSFTFEGIFNVWTESNPLYKKNFGFNNASKVDSNNLCIYPWFAEYRTSFDTSFISTDYETARYQEANNYLNKTERVITISMINDSLTTEIIGKVVDDFDDPLPNYVVSAFKYNIATDDFTLVTSETTGSTGKVKFFLDLTYEYKFEVYAPITGALVYTEPKQKLIETSYRFPVILGTQPESILMKLSQLDMTLTANSLGNNFTLVWNNMYNAFIMANLSITLTNGTQNITTVYNINSSDNSGILNYTIDYATENQSISFIARSYVLSGDDGVWYSHDSKTIDFKKAWDIFGSGESLLTAFLFVGTMTMIGVTISPILALLLTAVGMFFAWQMGFIVISLSGVMALVISLAILAFRLRDR